MARSAVKVFFASRAFGEFALEDEVATKRKCGEAGGSARGRFDCSKAGSRIVRAKGAVRIVQEIVDRLFEIDLVPVDSAILLVKGGTLLKGGPKKVFPAPGESLAFAAVFDLVAQFVVVKFAKVFACDRGATSGKAREKSKKRENT